MANRVAVTGGAGFIGSHLVDALVAEGRDVVVLDDFSTGNLSNLSDHSSGRRVEIIQGSILDCDLVGEVLSEVGTVFHLAAAVGVQLIVERPLESLITNIRGTEVIFEQALENSCRVLVTSTSEIYGKNTSDRLGEDDDRILGSPLKSRWSYSEAKAIDEILAYTYWREKGLETVIVRLFNTVGPRQTGHYGMVIPRFVSQALRNEPLTVFGTGQQTRSFCFVGDIVTGMIALCDEPQAFGQVFNLGGTEEISIEKLARTVIDKTGSSSEIQFIPYDEAYEAGFEDMLRRMPDTSKARGLVGFEARVTLDRVIDMVIAEQRQWI